MRFKKSEKKALFRMKIARQAATLVSKRANHQTQFGFGAMDFWSFLGTTKAKSAVTPYAEAPQAACTSKVAVIDQHNASEVAITTDSVDQGVCANQVNFTFCQVDKALI